MCFTTSGSGWEQGGVGLCCWCSSVQPINSTRLTMNGTGNTQALPACRYINHHYIYRLYTLSSGSHNSSLALRCCQCASSSLSLFLLSFIWFHRSHPIRLPIASHPLYTHTWNDAMVIIPSSTIYGRDGLLYEKKITNLTITHLNWKNPIRRIKPINQWETQTRRIRINIYSPLPSLLVR